MTLGASGNPAAMCTPAIPISTAMDSWRHNICHGRQLPSHERDTDGSMPGATRVRAPSPDLDDHLHEKYLRLQRVLRGNPWWPRPCPRSPDSIVPPHVRHDAGPAPPLRARGRVEARHVLEPMSQVGRQDHLSPSRKRFPSVGRSDESLKASRAKRSQPRRLGMPSAMNSRPFAGGGVRGEWPHGSSRARALTLASFHSPTSLLLSLATVMGGGTR